MRETSDDLLDRRAPLRSAAPRCSGPIEVEIFNEAAWGTPIDALVPLIKQRDIAHG
jgi:hypothetical protein